MAWLWKDHTGTAEAAEITALARKMRPQYLAKCGGTYSSEWFFSKILRCLRASPEVFGAAAWWVELADFVPAALTGTQERGKFTAGICAAGHKAMYNESWGGYPDAEFLSRLSPKLAAMRDRLCSKARDISSSVGGLSREWAARTGLREGIPVAVGAFDAHLGAVGAGIAPGTLVKIIGTSTCDIAVWPLEAKLPDIPGLCGIVSGSVLPGCYGLEAGQSAVGDIFNWFVNYIEPGGKTAGSHEALTRGAAKLRAGESGLLALDWNNGNRTVLVDQQLTGLMLGQTLYTTPAEIYRALIEATAFGALTIIKRIEEHRRENRASGQLRRHCRKKPAGDADLCRRDGPHDENIAFGANLRFGRGNGGGGGRTRASGFHVRRQGDDWSADASLQAGCRRAFGLSRIIRLICGIA